MELLVDATGRVPCSCDAGSILKLYVQGDEVGGYWS